uniref:protein-tyrosine-phosphatase n=1 Tax=Dermatophagoides pteronyssinus TaxID=6956 RepID=A0A6P6XPR3_DERPT|nr:tyrosine-protein phosphatase 10D-like [Dermatophagoides pteronyssinus]
MAAISSQFFRKNNCKSKCVYLNSSGDIQQHEQQQFCFHRHKRRKQMIRIDLSIQNQSKMIIDKNDYYKCHYQSSHSFNQLRQLFFVIFLITFYFIINMADANFVPPVDDLQVQVLSGKQIELEWKTSDIMTDSNIDGYKVTVVPKEPMAEHDFRPYQLDVSINDRLPLSIRNLTAGGTYEISVSVISNGRQSRNESVTFTTKPNTPGRFIVWFRNETTLLVLWQPPYPSGIFDQYKVSIFPQDAHQSILFVKKESDPPGPVQTSFDGLIPGRIYNITVQTVSRNQISDPTEAQYRTVPLSPSNLSFNRATVTSSSFDVIWDPPVGECEFDRYQISIGLKNVSPKMVFKDDPRIVRFSDEGLQPGETYEVTVKTVSGNVISSAIATNITTRPLPVLDLKSDPDKYSGIHLSWRPDNHSRQDSFIITYHELDAFNSDAAIEVTKDTYVHLSNLLAGRNYSISVAAISNNVYSDYVVISQPTKPASPVIGVLEPISGRTLNISWKWDVTSKQDSYKIIWIRNDTKEKKERIVRSNWAVLEDLYPGAIYEISVYAISHGLISDPHSYFQTIFPRPPETLHVAQHSNSSMMLSWSAPTDSLVDHYIARYRPTRQTVWRDLGIVNTTSMEIKNLVAGEMYTVRVSSVSNRAESPDIRELEQTMFPNSIASIKTTIDSHNITFQWLAPEGVIDYFSIIYNPVNQPKLQESRRINYYNGTRPGDLITVFIQDLKPGEEYSFRFYVISFKLRSEGIGVQVRTIPVIDSVINVIVGEHETKTLGIKYTPTPLRNVIFDRYRFQLSGTTIPSQEKQWNDTNRFVLFDNLIPGRLYNLSIWTISGQTLSVPIQRQARLYPEPIRNINGLSITDSEMTLSWDVPYGDKDGYEVQYFDPHEKTLVVNVTLIEKIEYRNLKPHNNYTFIVTTLSGYGTSTMLRSTPVSQTFLTLESVPGKVSYFQSVDVKPNEITLQWSLPQSEMNGILTGYKIVYWIKSTIATITKHQLFEPYETQGTIYNLLPGKTYVFQIQAHTKVGPGHKAVWEETMPVWSAPPPADTVFPTEVGHTTRTIRIRFRKNYFSNMYGSIQSYAIIVAEDDTVNSNVLDLPSWFDIQDYGVWPPYQTTDPFYPFNNSQIEDFVIGAEQCDIKQHLRHSTSIRGGSPKYCNGPLKPGSTYKIKIRAFTTGEKFTDTVYSYAMSTDPDHTALYLSILAPFIFLILLILLVVYLRRNRLGPFKDGGKFIHQHQHHHMSTIGPNGMPIMLKDGTGLGGVNVMGTVTGSTVGDNLSIVEGEIITNRPIKFKDFSDHFRLMSADSDFRFSEEFELLKHVGRDRPCNAADLPVNRPKNRFTNILPYDHSRVKLLPTDDEEGSDYINANYIPGHNSPREFIVTQGPLHSTRDDFWRMVWEQNSRAIVMLTRCIEKGREKCDRYWPYDTQPVFYGNIQVTILNETQYQDWTISEFKVMRGDQYRIVRHFHFTTWPDFGVPEPPNTLVKFVRSFRERITTDNNKPIVVHCSAGVGRSGTFIALDRILQHIKKYDTVDIFGIVHEMRKERVWMVQNEQQYICIHECLMSVLEGKEELIEMHENAGYEDDEAMAESGI